MSTVTNLHDLRPIPLVVGRQGRHLFDWYFVMEERQANENYGNK